MRAIEAAHIAFGDESSFPSETGSRSYAIAATIVASDDLVRLRSEMSRLNGNRKSKLHWHSESHRRRLTLSAAIGDFPVTCELATMQADARMSSERQRRLCLRALGARLELAGCQELILESRGFSQDYNDVALWKGLKSSTRIRQAMRLDHTPGRIEPLLWIPDSICGAFNTAARGDTRAWDLLKLRVTHVPLDSKGQPLGR